MSATTNTTGTAFDFAHVLNQLLAKYETTSQLKKSYSNLVNLYGKDEAINLMKAFKEARAAEVHTIAEEVAGNLTVSGLMEYAFKELSKGGKVKGSLAKLQTQYGQTNRAEGWSEFLAKYYPHTMEGGAPAARVKYTRDGREVYEVFEPLAITTKNAVSVLLKALASLDKGAQRVWVSGKPRLAWTTIHSPRVVEAAYEGKVTREILKDEEGNVLRDRYVIKTGERVEIPEGLKITDEHVTVKEFLATLNADEE